MLLHCFMCQIYLKKYIHTCTVTLNHFLNPLVELIKCVNLNLNLDSLTSNTFLTTIITPVSSCISSVHSYNGQFLHFCSIFIIQQPSAAAALHVSISTK